MLKNLQRTVSAANFKMYQSAVTSLLFQFATSAILMVPLTCFVIVVWAGLDSTQLFIEVTLAIGALHPIVNAVVVTLTTSLYREYIFRKLATQRFRVFAVNLILCMHTDIHLTLLIIPMPLSPLIAGTCNGILATYFKIWSHYLIAFIIAALISQMECLVYCFVRKHQIISKLVSRHVLSNGWYVFGTILAVSTPVAIGLVFSQAGMKREHQMSYVREHHATYVDSLLPLENFSIYSSNHLLIIVIAVTSSGGFLCGVLFMMITFDMLKMLKEVQTKVSLASFHRYKVAVTSLLAQFTTSSLLLAPLFLFVLLVASQIENSHDAAEILVAIMALHSPINAIVLVVTTPPFRNYVLRKSSSRRQLRRVNTFSNHSHGSFTRLKTFFSFL
ncbi:hypothetical protein GCK72_006887 [Caenorhabditis remanei]|uniref:Uncharacterized protein n=1 Tax=Caenorhabditis remanei TaxID=31234 RepID=A0A6A5HHS2_CAERE|nr:hypothetical protein GCK72_006887 [Caenorhabditis remanei]KAF1766929.1 hypothetical protein GCK72_006887 [Caenorhabditis remanei]